MSDYCGVIVNGHSAECDSAAGGGIKQRAVFVNKEDIDMANTVIDRTSTTHKVTHFQLKSGKTGYLIKGMADKKHLGFLSDINVNEDSRNDYTHTFNQRVYDLSEATLAYLKSLGNGANVVAIIENEDTGTNGNTKYGIIGFDRGLKVTEMKVSSLEGKGTTPVVMVSPNEPHLPMIYFDTDVATSDTAFEALFAQA